jgi:alpha-tubulin suppressor-like RCC1 family protein
LEGKLLPTEIAIVKDTKFSKIACGDNHSLAVSQGLPNSWLAFDIIVSEGRLFAWGVNKTGQVGKQNYRN